MKKRKSIAVSLEAPMTIGPAIEFMGLIRKTIMFFQDQSEVCQLISSRRRSRVNQDLNIVPQVDIEGREISVWRAINARAWRRGSSVDPRAPC